MNRFNSAEELSRYVVETVRMLREAGLTEAASRLERANGGTYSSGSEWLGELGLAVRAVRSQVPDAPAILERLNTIQRAVKGTWSGG